MTRRHAMDPNNGEFSLCGYSFDADETEGDEEAAGVHVDLRPGVVITCPHCCMVIRELRRSLKGVRTCPEK